MQGKVFIFFLGMKPLLNDRGKPYTEVLEYDGYLFPGKLGRKGKTKVSEILADLNELSFEDDEVCIVSYPKSGMMMIIIIIS